MKEVQYKMTRAMFNSIANTRQGEDKRKPAHKYVTAYVNEVYGVKGKVTKIIVK